MRLTFIFLICLRASIAFAGWLDDCPVKEDYRGQIAWLNEPVVWSNVVTFTTNTVVKDAGLWQLEQLYAGTLAKYGGSEQGNFAVNMQQLLAAKAAATNADQKADIVADGALIGQLYQYLKDANAAFDGLPPGTVTGITTNTTVYSWCAQKRWQSLGLDHLPTGSEVEDAQR